MVDIFIIISFFLLSDTTVQSLTVQPTVNGGLVTYQDSPLVRAARDGSILVVDEADKAPTQVTCILKVIFIPYNRFTMPYLKFDFFTH